MDIFKRSLFAGNLDAPAFQVGETRNDPSNWLHMEIETPRCSLPPNQATLKIRPKQLYGVGRSTVASVLLTTDALPGARVDWGAVFDIGTPDYTSEGAYSALAAIPFRDFPERGRRELEAIIAPIAKLTAWFEQLGWPVWAFLARAAVKAPGSGGAGRQSRGAGRRLLRTHAPLVAHKSRHGRELCNSCASSLLSTPIGRRSA